VEHFVFMLHILHCWVMIVPFITHTLLEHFFKSLARLLGKEIQVNVTTLYIAGDTLIWIASSYFWFIIVTSTVTQWKLSVLCSLFAVGTLRSGTLSPWKCTALRPSSVCCHQVLLHWAFC